jgi:hypothetical protein
MLLTWLKGAEKPAATRNCKRKQPTIQIENEPAQTLRTFFSPKIQKGKALAQPTDSYPNKKCHGKSVRNARSLGNKHVSSTDSSDEDQEKTGSELTHNEPGPPNWEIRGETGLEALPKRPDNAPATLTNLSPTNDTISSSLDSTPRLLALDKPSMPSELPSGSEQSGVASELGGISEYELRRLENIRSNNLMLAQLGLLAAEGLGNVQQSRSGLEPTVTRSSPSSNNLINIDSTIKPSKKSKKKILQSEDNGRLH